MKPIPKMPAKTAKPDPDGDDDAGMSETNEPGEGTPAEEAQDAREQAAVKKLPPVKKPAAKTAKAKPGAMRPASFYARMSKKSGPRTI